MSILEKLYEGKLYPAEQIKPNDPDYRKVTDEYCDRMDAASREMPAEEFAKIEKITDLQVQSHSYEVVAHFKIGLMLGIQFSKELEELQEMYPDLMEP